MRFVQLMLAFEKKLRWLEKGEYGLSTPFSSSSGKDIRRYNIPILAQHKRVSLFHDRHRPPPSHDATDGEFFHGTGFNNDGGFFPNFGGLFVERLFKFGDFFPWWSMQRPFCPLSSLLHSRIFNRTFESDRAFVGCREFFRLSVLPTSSDPHFALP